MKLESVGILISLRPMNERDSIARIFTRDFGVMCGVMRAAAIMKKHRPLTGQIGTVSWNARLDSQLGTFHWDAEKNLAAPTMTQPEKLLLMNSGFALLGALLPERECYASLYDETLSWLESLGLDTTPNATYLIWETNLLRELGYALDLHSCAGCGSAKDLVYMSPRTCRAVCAECGAPYASRLYRLPLTLDTTLCLLADICTQQGTDLPHARRMICNKI